ncbi:MAG: ATP-binding protein [Armatimonadetes bacterium]|nr:ATP-binding protein [Armatimonadota bacterium]
MLLSKRIARYLEKNIDKIADKVSNRIYQEIYSYHQGSMPKEESKEANRAFLDFIKEKLKIQSTSFSKEEFLFKDLVNFEEGIAARRLKYKIDLIDLLKGINILRTALWENLKNKFKDEFCRVKDFFDLEERINYLFCKFIIGVSEVYLKSQKEVLEYNEAAFKKWEEVVKSAHNIELNIPCREEFAAIARLQAEAIARRLRYDEEEVQDIKIAVGEACDNAIEHGFSRKGIDVHYHLSLDYLTIEVRDYGSGFNPEGKGELPADLLSERGRGLFLMKELMNSAETKSKLGEGTLITLTKKRHFLR